MSTVNQLLYVVFFSALLLWVSSAIAQEVNVNTATSSELQRIKGIGEITAKRIIEERVRGGHFESVEDFAIRVKGLGQKRSLKMVSAGLSFNNDKVSREMNSSEVAKGITAVKKRFKAKSANLESESYLLKAN